MTVSNLSSGVRPGVCLSTSRPTVPYEGQMIYETDTDMVTIWNGTAWRYIASTTPTNGTVLQVVTGSTSTQVFITSSTYTDTGLSATITPKSTSSKVLVFVHHADNKNTGAVSQNGMAMQLFRDTTSIQQFASTISKFTTTIESFFDISTIFLDSPATTSATTYKTKFSASGNNNGVAVQASSTGQSVITLMEIAG